MENHPGREISNNGNRISPGNGCLDTGLKTGGKQMPGAGSADQGKGNSIHNRYDRT